MKLDIKVLRYLTKEDFRVLTAIEMGMRNHEIVPVELVSIIHGLYPLMQRFAFPTSSPPSRVLSRLRWRKTMKVKPTKAPTPERKIEKLGMMKF